jgi:hypothetical protein
MLRESKDIVLGEESHESVVNGERWSRDGSERTEIKRRREGGHTDILTQRPSRRAGGQAYIHAKYLHAVRR